MDLNRSLVFETSHRAFELRHGGGSVAQALIVRLDHIFGGCFLAEQSRLFRWESSQQKKKRLLTYGNFLEFSGAQCARSSRAVLRIRIVILQIALASI